MDDFYHPNRVNLATERWRRRHDIDWEQFPSVIFESDDWGACEVSRHEDDAALLGDLWEELHGSPGNVMSTLETPDELDRLYTLLESFQGIDGQHPVFTAFVATGNPDYTAIRAAEFGSYVDIGIDEGVPEGWQRGDIVGKWHEGYERGVFAPEYHSALHHTNPQAWLERLRLQGPDGDAARAAFNHACYYQGFDIPEYVGMNVRQQYEWVGTGVQRFANAVGYRPNAAVCSDAYPVTETIWSLHGIRTICLKNSTNNQGERVVHHAKPWNHQDSFTPMGAYDQMNDVIYLGRNVFFESQQVGEVVPAIRACWARHEPAIISSHRDVYVSLDEERVENGFDKLKGLLSALTQEESVRFLTSAEVSDIYRRGWSLRRVGAYYVLRQYTGETQEMMLPGSISRISALPAGFNLSLIRHDDRTVVNLPSGDFLVELDANA